MPTSEIQADRAPLWLTVVGLLLGVAGTIIMCWWINADIFAGIQAIQRKNLAFSWNEHVFFIPGVLPIFLIMCVSTLVTLCNGLRPVMIMAKIQNSVLMVGFILAFGGYLIGRPAVNAYLEQLEYSKCPTELLPSRRTKTVYWVMLPSFCDDPDYYSQITLAEAKEYLENASQ